LWIPAFAGMTKSLKHEEIRIIISGIERNKVLENPEINCCDFKILQVRE
jgi:hypothetical protein